MLLVSADLTTVRIYESDITQLTIGTIDTTTLNLQTEDVTIITTVPATISVEAMNLSDDMPQDITRTSSSGVSDFVSRADHKHSAANLLLDGGNY